MQRRQGRIPERPFFPRPRRAVFLRRPNRFVIECRLAGRIVRAHLPNPGRLWELLIPGREVHLVRRGVQGSGGSPFTAVAVERSGHPIMLHTQMTNAVVRRLLEEKRIPGLADCRIVRSEVPFGRHRFDFLLSRGETQTPMILEVKSCTLFDGETAMFPDAVSERGKRHLLALADLAGRGIPCGVLFVVHAVGVRSFLPDYHTDPAFARVLREVRDRLSCMAVSVAWGADLVLGEDVRPLTIPWGILERENADGGAYLFVCRLAAPERIPVGGLGTVSFPEGYYVYVGSARRNLARRMARHLRKRKNMHWHIDDLAQRALPRLVLPIRTQDPIEHGLAAAMAGIADWTIPRFGASDCRCPSHLFGMVEDPVHSERFMNLLLRFRIGRLAADPEYAALNRPAEW